MFHVQVTLSCGDYNTLTIRLPTHAPRMGDYLICRICGKHSKVMYVGKPYPVKTKGTS